METRLAYSALLIKKQLALASNKLVPMKNRGTALEPQGQVSELPSFKFGLNNLSPSLKLGFWSRFLTLTASSSAVFLKQPSLKID
ncbi:hypothetical protein [Enterococcus rivorum]|uniref:Uncharacterized protein n=1 Tax=Enterococcus rivorum TaxID=762845 RepID=A0A1E5KYD9_9ENTE|nr:hypothetical protein [Enterococcus rivorum]OEH82804.1 hypothetical protein BCR26_11795 [Enterococcus rivorum]